MTWESMWKNGVPPGAAFDASKGACQPARMPSLFWLCSTTANLRWSVAVEPALQALIDSSTLPSEGKALVPGCGRGYAVKALAESGMEAWGE